MHLAPEARNLRIRGIEMASPGTITLEGSGEPIRELGGLIERFSQMDIRRKQAKEDLRRAEEENAHTAEMNHLAEEASEINLAREKMKRLSEFMEFRFGPEWRSLPEAKESFDQIVGASGVLFGLAGTGKVALPPAVRDAAQAAMSSGRTIGQPGIIKSRSCRWFCSRSPSCCCAPARH
jgi:hypothetical protein